MSAERSKKTLALIGQKIGRLTVLSFSGVGMCGDGKKRAVFRCRCECGDGVTNIVMVWRHHLTSTSPKTGKPRTQSCGCLHKEASRRNIELARKARHGN